MTDPAEPSAPRDPAEYRPKPVLSAGFWGLMVFGIVCVLAGAAIALLAPRLLAARPQARAEAPSDLLGPAPAAAQIALPPAPEPVVAPEMGEIAQRVTALEGHERSTAQAAAAALAAAALVEASQGSRPFPEELAALRAAAPEAPELAVLQRLAETGAPSRAALAESFPDYAARAASAARAPGEGAHLSDRIGFAISRVISVRRVDETGAEGPDGVLAQAERLVADGDVDRALRALDRLPPKAREALAPWRSRAERRAEIDRQAAALRARALADLSHAARGA